MQIHVTVDTKANFGEILAEIFHPHGGESWLLTIFLKLPQPTVESIPFSDFLPMFLDEKSYITAFFLKKFW